MRNPDHFVSTTDMSAGGVDEFNLFFEYTPMLLVNASLILMKFSPGTVKHIGICDADIGRHISDISTNITFETFTSDIEKVVAHGEVITREVAATGGKWYHLVAIPYTRQTGTEISGAIISFNDITELKLKQLELDRTNKNLMNINADLDNFVHIASHDLLGPLANIQLSINVMNQLEVAHDPQLHKFLEIINGSIKMFSKVVAELATIGKIENEMWVTEAIDVDSLINDLEFSIKSRIQSTKTTIKKELQIPQIHFSKKNLRSILYNLITNAIKFNSPDRDPVITISTKAEAGFTVLSVKDNGIGIPQTEFDNIFRMYGRLYKSIEGQGIGLYLIKKIVDAAGGNVIVESEEGKGSIFTINLKADDVV